MLRRTVARSTRLNARLQTHGSVTTTSTTLSRLAGFHSSAGARAKTGNSGADNSGDPDKTPVQVFLDTFRTEWGKSKELQENIKALQDETGRMSESESFKKAREAYDRAKKGSNTASSAVGKGLGTVGRAVGSTASKAWDSDIAKGARSVVNKTADSVDKATEPIRQTEFYKNVKDVIDDGSSIRYGGYEDKAARLKRRQQEEARREKLGLNRPPVKENPEAGGSVVSHATAKPTRDWSGEFDQSAVGKKWSDIKLAYEESENGFVSSIRSITDKIGSFFDETESAKVIRMFKGIDPYFNQEEFMREFRSYMLPEVLDAYVKGDGETLKMWLSEAPYTIWATGTKEYKQKGLYSDGRVLDIRGVDIVSAKILQPSEIPVFVIGCRAQEVHMYRDMKTGAIAAGMEDHVQLSTYAMVVTRVSEELDNPETNGWKILELVRGQTRDWM